MFNLSDLLKSYSVIEFSCLDKLTRWQVAKQLKYLIDDNDISMSDIIRDIRGSNGLSYCEANNEYIVAIGNGNSIRFEIEMKGVKKIIKSVEFLAK